MGVVTTSFTGVPGVDFVIIQRDPPIILSKTDQFSVDVTEYSVLVRRLKFKVGSTIKGVDTKLPDGSTNVKLSWEPGDLISIDDFADGGEFNFKLSPIDPF